MASGAVEAVVPDLERARLLFEAAQACRDLDLPEREVELLQQVVDIALAERIRVHKGVFVAVAGPNLETAAEYRMLRALGADTVGMSMVPENLVAVHAGMRVLGLSVVTDRCLPDALEPADVDEIIRIAGQTEPHLRRLVVRFLEGAS